MDTKWDKTAQGIPGAGMRGAGGPSTGAGMATGAPGPALVEGERQAQELEAQVRAQLAEAPGGKGDVAGREEYPGS